MNSVKDLHLYMIVYLYPFQTIYCTTYNEASSSHTVVPSLPNDATVIDLSVNSITTVGTNAFSSYTSLYWLSLGQNSISNIDNTAFDSTVLQELHLGNNPLTAVPQAVGSVGATLEKLVIRDTSITDVTVADMSPLVTLKDLDLANLFLTTWPGLANVESTLEVLDISYVGPGSLVDTLNTFGFTKLKVLKMTGVATNFPDFTSNLGLCNTIEILDFDQNALSSIDELHLSCFTSLKNINLANNVLIQVPVFAPTTRAIIANINLAVNSLGPSVWVGAFDNLPVLRTLNLAENAFDNIPSLPHSTALEDLNLYLNEIVNIAASSFTVLINLQNLNLSSNYIETFESLATIYTNPAQPLVVDFRDNWWNCDCGFAYVFSSNNGNGAFRSILSDPICALPPTMTGYTIATLTTFDLCGTWPPTTPPLIVPTTQGDPPTTAHTTTDNVVQTGTDPIIVDDLTTQPSGTGCKPFPRWYNVYTNETDLRSGSEIVYSCKTGYRFIADDQDEFKMNSCNNNNGEWQVQFTECEAIPVEKEEDEFNEPVEAPKAEVFGIIGWLLIAAVLILIILLDINTYIKSVRFCRRSLKYKCSSKPGGNRQKVEPTAQSDNISVDSIETITDNTDDKTHSGENAENKSSNTNTNSPPPSYRSTDIGQNARQAPELNPDPPNVVSEVEW